MEIELQCAGCGCRLAVPAIAAGKEIECPKCGQHQTAQRKTPAPAPASDGSPASASPATAPVAPSAEPAPPPVPEWFLKVPEGLIYGPIDVLQLNAWVAEGRVSPDCQLRSASNPEWTSAEQYYPVLSLPPPRRPSLGPLPRSVPAPARGGAPRPPSPAVLSPAVEPLGSSDLPALRVAPHRGLLVLLCAILSWITCPLLGIAAWNMAAYDLTEMREKRLDPAGYGQTQAGYYLSLGSLVVYTVLLVVGLLVAAATWLMYGVR